MKTELMSIKITPEGLRMLRMIAAATGEKHYETLDRVLRQELARALVTMEEVAHG